MVNGGILFKVILLLTNFLASYDYDAYDANPHHGAERRRFEVVRLGKVLGRADSRSSQRWRCETALVVFDAYLSASIGS